VEVDDLIREYLGRLEAASWPLSADRRAELVGEVREHIEAALADAGRRDAVTVRNVLERLGLPEDIVSTEVDTDPMPPRRADPPDSAKAAAAPAWGVIEVAAVLLLTFGAILLPLVGPALGFVLAWLSTRWTTREKLIATTIVVVVFVLPVLGLLLAAPRAGTPV
jgi:HAAS